MKASDQIRQSRRRWRWLMLLFFLALLLPSVILIYKAYDELKWEALHQQRQLAQALAERIDAELGRNIAEESQRSFEDYQFLQQINNQSPQQLSPLAVLPFVSRLPGLLGYFQVDSKGHFTTPLLPENHRLAMRWGFDQSELQERLKIRQKMLDILTAASVKDRRKSVNENSPEKEMPAPAVVAGAQIAEKFQTSAEEQRLSRLAFDNLVSQVEQKKRAKLVRKTPLPQRKDKLAKYRSSSKHRIEAVTQEPLSAAAPKVDDEALSINVFDKEQEPFQLFDMGNGYLVLYRQMWKQGARYIQGMILKQQLFVEKSVGDLFYTSSLADTDSLQVLRGGDIVAVFGSADDRNSYSPTKNKLIGETLLQYRLAAPLEEWQLRFRVNQLGQPAGSQLIHWIAGSLLLILVAGFYLMYRLGLRQIALISQQQDFVSAVSHELKTPLTSISMYSEMLREGWVDEQRKSSYYDFIYFESQRLSRLIGNVLQLARLSRNHLHSELKNISAGELLDAVHAAIEAQVERAEFKLNIICDESVQPQTLWVDMDHFLQIMINLVDNALKFSAKSEIRQLDISCESLGRSKLLFRVRDYGSGIEPGQMQKIFELFYRSENELTRETSGTGIGLALVKELVNRMDGTIRVRNATPGAVFEIVFPVC